MAIIQNRPGGHAVTLDFSNTTYQLTDFATPNTSFETVTNLGITKIFWTGDWTISRGANVIFKTSNNTGHWDLNKTGIAITSSSGATISVNTTSSSATLVLGVSKIGNSSVLTF